MESETKKGSKMAMRLAGAKRPLLDFHRMTDALPSVKGHMTEGEADIAEFSAKRSRLNLLMESSRESAALPARSSRDNSFPPAEPVLESELKEIVASLSPSKKPQATCSCAAAAVKEQYSLEDLTNIVNKAVTQREELLREEYERILAAKLNDQFRQFTQHNMDYLTRLAKSNNFSYVS